MKMLRMTCAKTLRDIINNTIREMKGAEKIGVLERAEVAKVWARKKDR